VKTAFSGHSVQTVTEAGWRGSKDGPLLRWAQTHFDVFVTIDRKIEHQQNLKSLRLGFVVARVPNNELASYRPLFDELKRAAEIVSRGKVVYVIAARAD